MDFVSGSTTFILLIRFLASSVGFELILVLEEP